MKIEWLDDDMRNAFITRGIWWWRESAYVVYQSWDKDDEVCWRFKHTGRRVCEVTNKELAIWRYAELRAREEESRAGKEWFPTPKLAVARVIPNNRIGLRVESAAAIGYVLP